MVRKRVVLAVCLAGLLSGLAPIAHGLGLGELELQSALNQPFRAEIPLVQLRGLEQDEIVPRLASADDFRRVGVERFFFLTDLTFTVDVDRQVLVITSKGPVSEPYLNFLIEVLWPSGRLLKEYTVLLDPPVFSDREPVSAAPPVAPRASSDAPGGRIQRPSGDRVQVAPRPAAPQPRAPSAKLQGDQYGPTDGTDTLWSIAEQARPQGATVQQTMLALERINPGAFINGNVNLMKAGYVLRLPDSDEATRIDRQRALALVAEHNRAFRERRPIRRDPGQLDASDGTTDTGGSLSSRRDELRVISGGATDGSGASAIGGEGTGSDVSGRVQRLEDQLALTSEEKDRLERENAEQQAALEEMRDALEALQAELAAMQAQMASSASPAPTDQPQPTDRQGLQVEDTALAQQQAAAAERAAEERAAAAEQQASQPAPRQRQQPSLLDQVLGNPLWLGGIAVILVALVAGALLLARRRKGADIDELEAAAPVTVAGAAAAGAAAAPRQESAFSGAETRVDNPDETTELSATLNEEPEDAPAPAAGGAEEDDEETVTSDAVGEADIYIAYGRFPQAISFLQAALEDDPERQEVRLKLMEVYGETRDNDGFVEQAKALVAAGMGDDALHRARQLQAKYEVPGADDVLAAASGADPVADAAPDFDSTVIDPNLGAQVRQQMEEAGPSLDLDLNLDDSQVLEPVADSSPEFDLDLDLGDDTLASADDAAGGDDFDLDISGLDDGADAGQPDAADAAAGDLGGDLGIDFRDDAASGAPAEGDEDFDASAEFSLDDMDLDRPSADSAADVAPAADLDGAALDDETGLDLTIDGRAAPVAPAVADEEAHGDAFSMDVDAVTDDGSDLDLTLSRADQASPASGAQAPEAADDFDLGGLEGVDVDAADDTLHRDAEAPEAANDDGTTAIDDDFDFLAEETDEAGTKLDLAKAYMDMGDSAGARDILDEVVTEGNEDQQQEAQELLKKLG